jgi:hypothetical protein
MTLSGQQLQVRSQVIFPQESSDSAGYMIEKYDGMASKSGKLQKLRDSIRHFLSALMDG